MNFTKPGINMNVTGMMKDFPGFTMPEGMFE